MILRPTAKAARLLGVTASAGIEPGGDDWYLNILWIDGRKNALLAHARTAFPILVSDVRVAQLRPLGRWLASAITMALAEEDLPADTFGVLDDAEPVIAKTASRQLLGFMNETAFRAEVEISHAGGLTATDIAAVNHSLRRDLHNYDGRYATPLELITGRRPKPDRRAPGGSLPSDLQQGVVLQRAATVARVMVTDLNHYLDMPPHVPGPARRLAEHLGNIVRAATAGDAGTAWQTTLPCRRRPANRACPGRMIVQRIEPDAPIRWQCSACDDTGLISNWHHSPYDLRRSGLTVAAEAHDVVIANETAGALRELHLLHPDCERTVFRVRGQRDHAIMSVTSEDLEELIRAIAAEANHEPNRPRQQRLDAALNALEDAAANCR